MEAVAVRIRQVGSNALLLELDASGVPPSPATWFGELNRRRAAGELDVVDIVPGATTVLLDGLDDPQSLVPVLRCWSTAVDIAAPVGASEVVVIPVTFDGVDLPDVAGSWGTDPDGVVDRITATEFTVAFSGFAPGFAYLTGLPAELAVPRLDTPRARVPAGSVGLAGPYAGIYPSASPGGWRLVGRTDLVLFDVERDPPSPLQPGTRVAFQVVAGQMSPNPDATNP
jgi:KipI family sensor histidine kinase inhibitor